MCAVSFLNLCVWNSCRNRIAESYKNSIFYFYLEGSLFSGIWEAEGPTTPGDNSANLTGVSVQGFEWVELLGLSGARDQLISLAVVLGGLQ